MAVRTPCSWVNESALGRRDVHQERDLADEVEDPQEEREELDEQRALRGVLRGVDDGELEAVEDLHQNEAGFVFEQKARDGVVLARRETGCVGI